MEKELLTFETSYQWHQVLTASAVLLSGYASMSVPSARPLFVTCAASGLTRLAVRYGVARLDSQRRALTWCGWWNLACAEVEWLVYVLVEDLPTQIHQQPVCLILGLGIFGCNAMAGCFTTTWLQKICMSALILIQNVCAHLRVPPNVGLLRIDQASLVGLLVIVGAIALATQVQALLGAAASARTRMHKAQVRAEALDLHAAAIEQIRRQELVARVHEQHTTQRKRRTTPRKTAPAVQRLMAVSESELN